MNLKNKSKQELESMIYDLINQRMSAKISPGEYSSRIDLILQELAKYISAEKAKQTINDAYDRAMRGI